MNYFKQLLDLNIDSNSENNRSPQLSGQFQIIQFQEDDEGNQQKNQPNSHKKSLPNDIIKKISSKQGEKQYCEENSAKANYFSQQQKQKMNKNLSKQYTIIEIDDPQIEESSNFVSGSASTIKIDDYYMIVENQQLNKRFSTQEEWEQLYQKIKCFHSKQYTTSNCSKIKSERPKATLNLQELNSILQLKSSETDRRTQYWNNIAVPSNNIKFRYSQLCNKKDPQKLERNVTKIMDNLASAIIFQITEKKYKLIENVEDELQKWKVSIIKLLTIYGANDKQIGYSKGLQYVALGILVAKPFQYHYIQENENQPKNQTIPSYCNRFNESIQNQLETHFKYLMFTKQLRNMYFPGTPKLYEQIELLEERMKVEVSQLYQKLNKINADFIKIFINYYKTYLLYRIKNPEVIRKIMQLLLIYGIDIVRVLLIRIMNKNQKKLLQIQEQVHLLKYIAESLVEDYFQNSEQHEVIFKFKQLFILEVFK